MWDELTGVVGRVAETVSPSVVRIGRNRGRGAGIVVGDGLVCTNAHNLRGSEVTVTFAGGRTETGTVAGVDADGDLAVLAVETGGAPGLVMRDEPPVLGLPVFAVANRASGPRVTVGTVSALGQTFRGPGGRRLGGSVEHTAPLGRGSSGGPVVDAAGRLVGINTNRLPDGFYLALPATPELRARVEGLGRGESPTTRRLGVALAPAHAARQLRRAVGLPERDGLLVRAVEDDSPAAAAGLRQGDLIVEADGRPLLSADDLFDVLDGLAPDATLRLRIARGVDELEVAAALT
ncbi:MAG: S1C family serine protease [Acidimicrobiia bacterium]